MIIYFTSLLFYYISGESISDILNAIGGSMTIDAFDIVLKHLGIDVS
jgi:hypothetical protein